MQISPSILRRCASALRLMLLLALPPVIGGATGGGGAQGNDGESPFVHLPDAADSQRIVITTRSLNRAPSVAVFAPSAKLGETAKERPAVWWYLSRDTELPIKLTVNEPKRDEPLLEVTLRGKHKNGFHRFDLAASDVAPPLAFKPDVPYEFAVSVVVNENSPAANPASIAKIKRTTRERPRDVDGLKDPFARAEAYRRASFWYDYVDDLNNAIERNDARLPELQRRRRNLLAQEGLLFAADGTVTQRRSNGQGGKQ